MSIKKKRKALPILSNIHTAEASASATQTVNELAKATPVNAEEVFNKLVKDTATPPPNSH